MLNGVTDLFVTKPDVMNDFAEVKMCTAYEIEGRQTAEIPFEFNTVEIKPVLKSFEGWREDISRCKEYNELPARLRDYLDELESAAGVRIMAVSISPDRKDVLYKN